MLWAGVWCHGRASGIGLSVEMSLGEVSWHQLLG